MTEFDGWLRRARRATGKPLTEAERDSLRTELVFTVGRGGTPLVTTRLCDPDTPDGQFKNKADAVQAWADKHRRLRGGCTPDSQKHHDRDATPADRDPSSKPDEPDRIERA
ncbi:MAG: hypothetical protein AAGB48_10625 [Planctomycetota bacterium]